jgi:hypothetical protein
MTTQQAPYIQFQNTMHQPFASEGPLSESLTPVEDYPFGSDSPTPIEANRTDIPMDQVTLRLHLTKAIDGTCSELPNWPPLVEALRDYFQQGWQRDVFSLEFCERAKHFLFWNAVADMKMKKSKGM